MNHLLVISFLVSTFYQSSEMVKVTFFQSADMPKVWRIIVFTKDPAEIVFEYAWQTMPENQPLKKYAVECFISNLKSTGLFTNVKVDQKLRKDGKGIDISIKPTWHKHWKQFMIGEIDFEDFTEFDLMKIKTELYKQGFHSGISLWKFSLRDIANLIYDAISTIYFSDDSKKKIMIEKAVEKPRFYLKVIGSENVKLTISLRRNNQCS
ncbi:MAG: hypothetical protein AB1757_31175 [Acidobacteriota bacterium]